MKRCTLTDDAKQDLADIKAYLTKESGVNASRHVIKRIKEGMDFLGNTPGAGHLREDLTAADVKFWLVFSYLILYKATARPLGIVRVLHGSRYRPPSMLPQDD